MDPGEAQRWERVKRLVDEALARAGDERVRFLDESCAGDPTLRAEVESLLRHDGEGPLDTSTAREPTLAGTELGHYQLLEEIGRGGMGCVYRALDRQLGRAVAIKVLPGDTAGDPERLRRFEREARLSASLNHPGIATVHGMERAGDVPFLVLELVEGQTLAERLRQGRLPVEEALELGRQIADALEAAHERGIVHRDLKPSNVALTPDGKAKVLDFGLAKALGGYTSGAVDSPSGPPAAPATTREGLVMGTPPYMSPEQVGGQKVDHRSDNWSFGVLLFEMLSGRRAFEGDSASQTLGAVLRDEPAWAQLPAETPAAVVALLRRCLTRDRRQRLQAIGEARIVLENPDAPHLARGVAPGGGLRGKAAGIAILALAALVAGGAAVFALRPASGAGVPTGAIYSALTLPPGRALLEGGGLALSPDGRKLAFVAVDIDAAVRLFVRPLEQPDARALPGTEDAEGPFWSTDSREIAFFAGSQLKIVSAGGGAVRIAVESGPEPRGGAWSPDGRIVFALRRSGLLQVREDGGTVEPLTTLDDGELSHRWPRFLPGGRRLLFLAQTSERGDASDRSRLEVLDENGERQVLQRALSSGAFANGHLLFWRENDLYARALDLDKLTFQGEARRLLQGVHITRLEEAAFSVGRPASLVYQEPVFPARRFEILDSEGRREAVRAPEGRYDSLEVSPDGGSVAYTSDETSLWILDLRRGTRTRMTSERVDYRGVTWSPDGRWIVYVADAPEGDGGRVFRQSSSGLGEREELFASDQYVDPAHWSPDGRRIAFTEAERLRFLDPESGEVEQGWPGAGDTHVFSPRFSPDGRWLAYSSDESGRDEVYVADVARGDRRWRASVDGGYLPRWKPGGDQLYFRDFHNVAWSVEVSPGEEPRLGVPAPVFPEGLGPHDFAFLPDGRMLLLVYTRPRGGLYLVQNWPRLLDPPRP